MGAFDSRLLSIAIFFPLVIAVIVGLLPKGEKGQIRVLTLIGMVLEAIFCAMVFFRFDPQSAVEFQLEHRTSFLTALGASYHVGVDGLAASLVALTGLLGPLVVLGSWSYIEDRVKEFHIALLVQQTAMVGALCSMDLLLFYIFFEASLIPMYLLIGVWGSEERRMATMKFFVYTMAGSLLLLVALLGVSYIGTLGGDRSFDYQVIYNGLLSGHQQVANSLKAGGGSLSDFTPVGLALRTYGPWFLLAFSLAFAIKVPMFPLHTWLPDAHVQAPAAGSVILAGVLLKLGTFGFWRYAIPLFPVGAKNSQLLIGMLALIGIIYGALMCLAQRDVKRLIAFSSVSHLGYCMLGIAAMTVEGALGSAYQMLNHGISTGALFLLFGFLYERRHARLVTEYGGIAKVMPIFTAFFLIATFSSIAVPATNGFIGEFLVLVGSYRSELPLWMSIVATSGVILGAAYMLRMVQQVFFGKITHEDNAKLTDLNAREIVATLPFLVLIVVMGLRPQPILDVLQKPAERFVARSGWATRTLDREKVEMKITAPSADSEVARR